MKLGNIAKSTRKISPKCLGLAQLCRQKLKLLYAEKIVFHATAISHAFLDVIYSLKHFFMAHLKVLLFIP